MIRAVIFRTSEGWYSGFSAKGHAGYAEEGSDIVCAAVSVLTTTCVNALESVADVKPVVREVGDAPLLEAYLPASLDEGRFHDAQVLIGALRQGLSDLSEAYPRYIHLSIQERRETP
jgi:uncharacterized protein YsxB (DUF464 family)